jgi:hypothetical protein
LTKIIERRLLQVEYNSDPSDSEYIDRVEAYLVSSMYGSSYWHVGGEGTSNYVSIFRSDVDAWIELLTAMKNYKEEK